MGGIFVKDQAEVLARKYDIAVLFPKLTPWREAFRKKFLVRMRGVVRENIKEFSVKGALPPRMPAPVWYYFYLWVAAFGLKRISRVWGRPDIIHAHVVLPAGWAAKRLGDKHRVPVVLTEHSGPFKVHLATVKDRTLVREAMNGVNQVVAVSPALASDIHSFIPTVEVRILGNVIRSDIFKPTVGLQKRRTSRNTIFLSVGSLNEAKGVSHLITAAGILWKKGQRSFELVIGGEGPERPRLQVLSRSLGISNHCRFLGMLSRAEVCYWMQHCDVFVLPSLGETFSVVLGEAMACGKPVIATRCGGPEYVVPDEAGILVEMGDAKSLACAMEKFITGQVEFDPHRIRESILDRFGEEVFLAKMSDVYRKLT